MDDIISKVVKAKVDSARLYPRNVNYASDAGHPCERYLYLARKEWTQKLVPDVGLLFIFARGKAAEAVCDAELKAAGYMLVEHSRPYEWKEYKIRGYIDRKILVDGKRIPCEYKTCAPYSFDKINNIQDMFNSDRHYIRQWPTQLLLYMWMAESEQGLFYIKNSLTWYPKALWVNLHDYDNYIEWTLQKLERVNSCVTKGLIPDPFTEDPAMCRDCSFIHACEPDLRLGKGFEIMDNSTLEEELEERERLIEPYKRYKQVDKKVKESLQGVEKAVVGNFLIEGKEEVRPVNAQPAREDRFWKLNIKRI